MIRVKDDSDNIVTGLFKTEVGSIIVDKQSEYSKYLEEKQRVLRLNTLELDINSIKQDLLETKELLLLLLKNKG